MKKIRFYSFFCIFILLFANIVFAEQQNEEIPDYIYVEETERGTYYLPNEKYDEYVVYNENDYTPEYVENSYCYSYRYHDTYDILRNLLWNAKNNAQQ